MIFFFFSSFADYGTMLEIRDVQYFADGRSVIDTVGGRRFKVVSKDTRDGYDTAQVEFFQDDCPSENDLKGLLEMEKTRLIHFLLPSQVNNSP